MIWSAGAGRGRGQDHKPGLSEDNAEEDGVRGSPVVRHDRYKLLATKINPKTEAIETGTLAHIRRRTQTQTHGTKAGASVL